MQFNRGTSHLVHTIILLLSIKHHGRVLIGSKTVLVIPSPRVVIVAGVKHFSLYQRGCGVSVRIHPNAISMAARVSTCTLHV